MPLRRIALLAPLGLVALAAACSAVQTYPGAPRPDDELAFLESGNRATILGIGEQRYSTGSTFALLPGSHAVDFEVFDRLSDYDADQCNPCNAGRGNQIDLRKTSLCRATLTAEAGHRYRIVKTSQMSDWEYRLSQGARAQTLGTVRIVDLATGEDAAEMGSCRPKAEPAAGS